LPFKCNLQRYIKGAAGAERAGEKVEEEDDEVELCTLNQVDP
jgi:hypothetical protein